MYRTALACLAFLTCATSAFAQAPATEDGIGPYRFGMSVAQARATAPNANWTAERQDSREVLTGGPRIILGASMNAALVFVDDSLRRLVLVAVVEGDCSGAVSELVEALEPLYGRFGALSPAALEESRPTQVARTAQGSEVRTHEVEGQGATVSSARYGDMYVLVQGRTAAGAENSCRITVTLGPQSDWARSQPRAGLTWAQLDAAESLVDVTWRRRPNAGSFERAFPLNALRRGIDGATVLDCLVMESGRLNCLVASEQPTGWGFGDAALDVARDFRVDLSGAPAVGHRVRIRIRLNSQ
jgi:hypothetical protein